MDYNIHSEEMVRKILGKIIPFGCFVWLVQSIIQFVFNRENWILEGINFYVYKDSVLKIASDEDSFIEIISVDGDILITKKVIIRQLKELYRSSRHGDWGYSTLITPEKTLFVIPLFSEKELKYGFFQRYNIKFKVYKKGNLGYHITIKHIKNDWNL